MERDFERRETLPAIKVADEILRLATTIREKDIDDALNKISQAESTWGLLWGLDNIERSGKDLEYYEVKGKVLQFLKELRKEKIFPLVYAVAAINEQCPQTMENEGGI